MITKDQRDLFNQSIIAQDDDNDYQESGYVAVSIGDWAAITRYGHCSCFGTWTDITGGNYGRSSGQSDIAWGWQGSVAELIEMAKNVSDPAIPSRKAVPEDCDYDHLIRVYKQILDWASKRA